MKPKTHLPPAAYLRLLHRIRRRYKIVTNFVQFGEVRFPFTRVADPDAVLDEVADAEDRRERSGEPRRNDPPHLPYWAELWDSAIAVAHHVADDARHFDGKDVLDLGCGQGLSGCVAAACGARVLFADLETSALLFARLNGLQASGNSQSRKVNWQTDRLGRKFDYILGADILYEKSQWQFLEPFWQAHLKPNGQVLIGEPGRPSGDAFLEWISPKHWHVSQSMQSISGREKPVRILSLQKTPLV